MVFTGYLAPVDLEHELENELALKEVGVIARYDRLFLSEQPPIEAHWAANIWHDVQRLPITSIGNGAKQLRSIQRNWANYESEHAGRARLIADKLPFVSAKPLEFGATAPEAPLGSWMLADSNLILAAAECTDPFSNGEAQIVEDKVGPPSRAYLKLWEALARARRWPQPGESCLDLGASPGGWTWVAAKTGADVTAVDKAPLADNVAAFRNVHWEHGSAFALDPTQGQQFDWLFSDIICYPGRLLSLVQRWLDADAARNIICSIKFQGPADHDIIAEFAAIEGATVRHLHHNKHELTFCRLDPLVGPK